MEMRHKHESFCIKEEATLYRIGVFAAMNHVSVRTLRFYEEQGLLQPVYTSPESGYRYYELSQMAVIHQITALKNAGFTLEEIARINSGEDEESILACKKSELLARIADLTRQIAVVDGYLSRRRSTLSSPVLIKTIPEVTAAAMQTRLNSYDCLFDAMPAMGELMERAGCECAKPEYCITNYLEPGYRDEDILVELCEAVTEAREEADGLYFRTLPEVTAACIYHHGSYATLSETYEAVLRYIEDNGYIIDGSIRESYIDGVWNRDDERDWLTEIQITVTKK